MSRTAQLVDNALDGLRSIGTAVFANQLTVFLATLAKSSWTTAVASIDPITAAPVIAVATVLTFVRGNKKTITPVQAEAIVRELRALAETQDLMSELLRSLAKNVSDATAEQQLSALGSV